MTTSVARHGARGRGPGCEGASLAPEFDRRNEVARA